MNPTLRVMVVDDTIIYRKIVSDMLTSIPGIEVVGVAHNGKIARDKIKLLKPDLITLDIEMPVMNGIELLEDLKKSNTDVGVVMLSTLTAKGSDMTLKALELGAFDFILKPQSTNSADNISSLKTSLTNAITTYRLRNTALKRGGRPLPPRPAKMNAPRPQPVRPVVGSARRSKSEIVTIGVSTGGPNALTQMLPYLPGNLGVPIVIVQHMPPVFTASLAASLDKKCALKVKEAESREVLQNNTVYIAPGGKQMRIIAAPDGMDRLIKITDDPPENSCKPAADYLFRSVADYYVGRCTAVILTGMGADGTKGLKVLKEKGAFVIGQDEASCVVYGMPKSAYEAGVVDSVLPLKDIAVAITNSVRRI